MALMMEERYDDFADLRERAKREVAKVVIGQDRTVELLLIAAVSHGHVLIEGPPGSAKTLLARAVAHMPSCETAVSPCRTSTSSMPTPSSSATICAQDVSWPWPCGDVPVTT